MGSKSSKIQAVSRTGNPIYAPIGSGNYSWSIDETLLDEMMDASAGEYFDSPTFQMCGLNWELTAYPNGYGKQSSGSFIPQLWLQAMPSNWQDMRLLYTIECPEVKSSLTYTFSYLDTDVNPLLFASMTGNLIRLSELKNFNKITISIKIEILEIISMDNQILYRSYVPKPLTNTKYTFKIPADTFEIMQNCEYGKHIESPIYDKMWCISIWPSGWAKKDKGYCSIDLQLCGLEQGTSKLRVEWKVDVILDGKQQKHVKTEWINDFGFGGMNKGFSYHDWGDKILSHKDIKKSTGMIVSVELKILNEYDDDGHDKADEEEKKQYDEYEEEDGDDADLARETLKEWNLSEYETELIDDGGWDDMTLWPSLEIEYLIQNIGMKEGHAHKFVYRANGYVQEEEKEEQVIDDDNMNNNYTMDYNHSFNHNMINYNNNHIQEQHHHIHDHNYNENNNMMNNNVMNNNIHFNDYQWQ